MLRTSIILGVLLFSMHLSYAQFGGLLRTVERQAEKSVNKRLNKEVEKKVDEEVNKGIDKILTSAEDSVKVASETTQTEQQTTEENYEERISGIMKAMGVGVDVAHEEIYHFTAKMDMLIEHTNGQGKEQDAINYYSFFNKKDTNYAIQFTDETDVLSYFIFDTKNKCTLILTQTDGEKTGIATTLDEQDIENIIDTYTEDDNKTETAWGLKKTGKSKKISGYSCDEYLSEDDESIVHIWLTDDIKDKINKSLYKSSIFGGAFGKLHHSNGIVIQYDITSKTDKEHSLMTVTSISFKADEQIDVTPYQIMGIGVAN